MFGPFCLYYEDRCYKVCQYHQSQNSHGKEMEITGKQGNHKSARNDDDDVEDGSCYFVAYWGLFLKDRDYCQINCSSIYIPWIWLLLPADSK